MEVVIGSASEAVVKRSRRISRTVLDERLAIEHEWFAKLIEEKTHLNNHQFFNWLATRPEAVGLLRWCLFILKGSSELFWFCAEAREVYEAPTSSQPHLLKILERYE